MREIAISKFKATCLAEMERVRQTRAPLRVTRFGKPVADIVPPALAPNSSWIGCAQDITIEVSDDIIGPTGALKNCLAGRP